MKTVKKQSHSNKNQQQKLKILCDNLCDKAEDLFDYFEIDHKDNGRFYSMCCPIHGGDNPSAINIYPEGESYRGNWKCRTHNCEEVFQPSIIGFVRGLLSNKKYNWSKSGDETCSFKETLQFCEEFTNTKLQNIRINRTQQSKHKFNIAMRSMQKTQKSDKPAVTRNTVRSSLAIPSQYYIDRGYRKDIMDKYDVGLCSNPKREMHNRVVVPIYDMNYETMVGCTGRNIYEKCDKCGGFHDPSDACPSAENLWKYSKWKHNSGFKTQEYLYNFWFAKQYIKKSMYVILVESPGNVWKLEENGIHNSVAIFGTNLSNQQKLLLDSSGAMCIFTIMDNDDAGRKAAQNISKNCDRTYNVYNIEISANDIADMTPDQIDIEIKKPIQEYL